MLLRALKTFPGFPPIPARRQRPAWRHLSGAAATFGVALHLFTVTSGQASSAPSPANPAGPTARIESAQTHWAFRSLPQDAGAPARSVDHFVRRQLRAARLDLGRTADRRTLIRRVSFTLTGLPPTPGEIAEFESDHRAGAYQRMCERYLASPRHGERWAQHWLDAAGYADSNGYFSADTDRPLAYRYRDYVIRSFNRNKPFDQFVREQLAGDELSGWKTGQPATPAIVELLEATHFLRNGQDGSGESDGNPDEVRTDRYYALESALQIAGSSLLGLTLQCAKCHDHKFEPITQLDYYGLQAIFYPAFHIEKWVKPNDRVVQALLPGELEAWQTNETRIERALAEARAALSTWMAAHRVPGRILFADRFEDTPASLILAARWSPTAPDDDAPAGVPPVALDAGTAPAARQRAGQLEIIEGGGSGDRWLCTRESFDWRPAETGQWVQATFDLVATQLPGQTGSAERIGYLIAAHDFNDSSPVAGGNLLIDGNPGGPTSVHLDYPGSDSASRGSIGGTGYKAGRNYGVRITRTGADDFTLEHLVDGATDGAALKLRAEHLPPGAFAFEYCCGRSFVVDNVVIEASDLSSPNCRTNHEAFQTALAEHRADLERTVKKLESRRQPKPGRIAWTSDVTTHSPIVPLLKRGNHKTPGDPVEPAVPAFLAGRPPGASARLQPAPSNLGTGRRLALAQWLTDATPRPPGSEVGVPPPGNGHAASRPASPAASLLARVTVNRIWHGYFGTGLAASIDNLGLSGAKPSHPELLDWLAARFIESGWNLKAVHRLILESSTFQQSSAAHPAGLKRDPDNHLLWRYPMRRLDAEAIRDAILAVTGRLGSKTNGPYVPTSRSGNGEVVVDESQPDGFARSIFLQHRRTQVPTFLGTFDAPSVVFACSRRATTTMPLQSLSLLNSDFAVKRGEDLARRLQTEDGARADDSTRIRRAFILACGRPPDRTERDASLRFLERQKNSYAGSADAEARVWADFAQAIFALNAFLYLE